MIKKFLILTFSISWIMWLPGIIQNYDKNLFPADLIMTIGMLGTVVPSAVGFIMMKKGVSIKELLFRLFQFNINIYVIYSILVIPILLFMAHILNIYLFDGETPAIDNVHLIPIQFIVTLLLLGPLNEEIGWRGFLHTKLIRRFPSTVTGLIIGVIWTLWHVPAFFIDVLHFSKLPIMQFFLTCVLTSILISFLQSRCRCGIWPGLIIHTLINLGMELAPLFHESSYTAWIIANILLGLTTLLVIIIDIHLRRTNN